MGPEGIILVNPPNTTLQQSLTHSALGMVSPNSSTAQSLWPDSQSIKTDILAIIQLGNLRPSAASSFGLNKVFFLLIEKLVTDYLLTY